MGLDVRLSVEFAAVQMENKLQKNDHKGGWEDPAVNIWHLFERMKQESWELEVAIEEYQAEPNLENINDVISECADVCNFAMMVMTKVCETMRGLERGRPKK